PPRSEVPLSAPRISDRRTRRALRRVRESIESRDVSTARDQGERRAYRNRAARIGPEWGVGLRLRRRPRSSRESNPRLQLRLSRDLLPAAIPFHASPMASTVSPPREAETVPAFAR